MGYVHAVTNLVARDKTSVDLVTNVTMRVMDALAPGEMEAIAARLRGWNSSSEPQLAEGRKNGSFIALFMHGDREADATELAIEAFKQARARAPVFDQMRHQTNERGRAAMFLCDVLFFDKIFKRGTQPAMQVASAPAGTAMQESGRAGEIVADVKQVARENTARRRQAIERTPRASLAEIGLKAAQFSPRDLGPGHLYNIMRRDDFCDVVITALRAGTLPDNDATFAVYLREWVLSGGDIRMSFVEWMESGECLNRIGVLQNEWLSAASNDATVKRMSLNQWLAATDTRLPRN
jgi:hypothetical protein